MPFSLHKSHCIYKVWVDRVDNTCIRIITPAEANFIAMSAEHPVLDAASAGHLDTLQRELSSLSIDQPAHGIKDASGRNALHLASQSGHWKIVKLLLESKDLHFHPDAEDTSGVTPLALAVSICNVCTVAQLILKGANVNTSPSLVRAAAKNADPEVLHLLLKAGASPDGDGIPDAMPPLFLAAALSALKPRSEEEEDRPAAAEACVHVLLKAGANPDLPAAFGYRPLHVAAEAGNSDMVAKLLEAGADATVKNKVGETPADMAATWGHRELAETLLAAAKDDRSVESIMKGIKDKEAAAEAASKPVVPQPEHPDESKAEALKQRGNAAFTQGKYEQAYDLYREALTHWTAAAALWANASAAELKLGRPQEALQSARLARTVNPAFVKGWYREGAAAEALEMWEDAAAAYFQGVQLQPEGGVAEEYERLVRRCAKKAREAAAAKKAREEASAGEAKSGVA